MAHREGCRTYEALPGGAHPKAFDWTPHRIRPIEYPDYLFMLSRCFEHIKKCCNEGINPTAEILKVDKKHIEAGDIGRCGTAHIAVQTKNRNPVHRIMKIRRFDHIVLLVAAEPMLRTK